MLVIVIGSLGLRFLILWKLRKRKNGERDGGVRSLGRASSVQSTVLVGACTLAQIKALHIEPATYSYVL